ncbi:MAG: hypothetical protein II922_12140 [Succinimonas sp.]|nr:hypothetical protein [Succinimonas sp.]
MAIIIIVFMMVFLFIDDTSHSPKDCDILCRLPDNLMTQFKVMGVAVLLYLVWALTGWKRIQGVMVAWSIALPIVYMVMIITGVL